MRIGEILHGVSGPRKRSAWAFYVGACLAAMPLGAVQIAVAQTNGAVQAQPAVQVVAANASTFNVAPLSSGVVSAFGPRTDPWTHRSALHDGVDYSAPEGTAIAAPAAGRVTREEHSRHKWDKGDLIEIDHGGGLTTQYWHLSAFDVAVGQQVAAGQVIGRVGNTGRSTGPHLHFMVLRDGQPIDPASVLPAASAH